MSVSAAGTWALAQTADGRLARVNTAATDPPTVLAASGADRRALVASDGRVLIATGAALAWWTGAAAPAPYVTLPHAVSALFPLDDAHAIARDAALRAYLVDLRTPRVELLDPAPADALSRTRDAGLVALSLADGARIVDLAGDTSWRVARAHPHTGDFVLTPDGGYLYMPGPRGLAVWPIHAPRSPAETAHWLDSLTNAHWDAAAHAPEW